MIKLLLTKQSLENWPCFEVEQSLGVQIILMGYIKFLLWDTGNEPETEVFLRGNKNEVKHLIEAFLRS